MTAFRAAFKAYRMHQVLIMPRFARLTIALGLATAVFPVDAEYYFNPRFLSNDLAESVDLSAFTKGREAPPGTYRVDIYLNDEFMTSRDITFIADDNNAELIPCLSTDLLVSLGIKKIALLDNKEHSLHKRFLLATFCALFTATLQAADVTITVNGRVVAKPCTIQTKEANVNLGDLYTRNLQQPGSASGWHNITLSLTDCPVETSAVTAIVTGSTDNTGYYKNEGTAENIQIELRDDQDATLKNGDSKTVIVDEITRNAQFPLKARAITVNGNASQGTIEALINVIYTWQ